jgi:hypothetical protein
MRNPGHNQLDRQRRLTPRDYAGDPWKFGRDDVRFHIPEHGDPTSAKLAAYQHQLVLAWRRGGCRPSGAEMARTWGCSKATISRTMSGSRWAGQAGTTALVWALQRQQPAT